MRDGEYDTTIGTGGWLLVGFSGVVTFGVLRGLLQYHLFPSLVFALAIALVVLLVLYRLAATVNRYDDEEEARRVRKIVPASADAGVRAGAAGAVAVPVRPETVTPLRPSSVVTPLARVEPAPIVAPPPLPETASSTATEATPVSAAAKATKPKATAKPKTEKPAAKAKPSAKAAPAEKPAKSAAKPKAAAKSKAAAQPGLVRLTAPLGGRADDLKEIEGIGPALEKMVNGLGFYHFDQIAAWSEADVALIDAEMKTFKGRIARDKWVAQARIIVTEGLEAFRERAKTNDY
jgi:predicted flap endonuclease-1-like 5' DNA nuclease